MIHWAHSLEWERRALPAQQQRHDGKRCGCPEGEHPLHKVALQLGEALFELRIGARVLEIAELAKIGRGM